MIVGEIDDLPFDLPLIREQAGNRRVARGHDLAPNPDPASVEAAVLVALPPTRTGSANTHAAGKAYAFGVTGVETGLGVSPDGMIASGEVDHSAWLEVNSDG
ncbi:MAG: hypothetical protein AAGF79_03750 [Pseudomonadota bacterium]